MVKTFKVSTDPQFAEKFWDVIGLYLDPPERALVLCCDEKSQCQALERTQPGLPLRSGSARTQTHDYRRHGTITLFAALNYLDGKLISRTEVQHTHIEWLRFLKQIDRETPPSVDLYLIVDNYCNHKDHRVRAWLAKHPRFHLHFTPTSASWLNLIEVLSVNPAAAVRGPKHVVTKGATPVMTPAEARKLLEHIDTGTLAGLRDRALFSVMLYSFARVSAVLGMRRQDYFGQGSLGWLRLHEKGGKRHDVPAHHRASAAIDEYVEAAGLEEPRTALFQSVDPAGRSLTGRALQRRVVLAMIKRRAAAAGLPPSTCCHTFRATGITAYLSNGGTLEHAQQIAGHASPKTTKLYDRTADTVTVDEIERIVI